jgi:2-polyprenyl-3-methyl-5-hydroxy-6-metoxy-1,4-benzoquinol methylase
MAAAAVEDVKVRESENRESEDHYHAVSKDYHTAFFYTGEYEAWQQTNILRRLKLKTSVKLVDIGGGTGRFALLLHDVAQLSQPVVCVDPSAGMLEAAGQLDGVVAVCSGGVEFAQDTTRSYDRALIKEVVHHIPDEALADMYAGIFEQLTPGGVCLTVILNLLRPSI